MADGSKPDVAGAEETEVAAPSESKSSRPRKAGKGQGREGPATLADLAKRAPASRWRAAFAALIGATVMGATVVLPMLGAVGLVDGRPFASPLWALMTAGMVAAATGAAWIARPTPWHLWGTWPLAAVVSVALVVLGFATEEARLQLLPAAAQTAAGVALAAAAYQWARARIRGLLPLGRLDRKRKVKLAGADGKTKKVAASAVVAGDELHFGPGDDVPVDGTVVSGSGFVDESALTGAEIPVAKRAGDPIYGGSVSSIPSLVLRVEAPIHDAVLERRGHALAALAKRLDVPGKATSAASGISTALALVASVTVIAQYGVTELAQWLPPVAGVLLAASAVAPALALAYGRFLTAAAGSRAGLLPSRVRDVEALGRVGKWQVDPMLLAAPAGVESHLFGDAGEDKLLIVASALLEGRPGPEARSLRRTFRKKGLKPAQVAATRGADGVSWGTVLGARWFVGTLAAVDEDEAIEVTEPVRTRVGQLERKGSVIWLVGRQDQGVLGALQINVAADPEVAAASKVLDATVMTGLPDATRGALAEAASIRRDGPPATRRHGSLLAARSERPSAGLTIRVIEPKPGQPIPTGASPRLLAGGVRNFGAVVKDATRIHKVSAGLAACTAILGPLVAGGLALVHLMGPLVGAALGLGAIAAVLRVESVQSTSSRSRKAK